MHISLARQLVSFVGAMMILIAYAGHQLQWMHSKKFWYNFLNAAGSGILSYIAFQPFQLGFVIMEITWTLISLYVLFRVVTGSKTAE